MKRSDDVFFFTLIDFLVQVFFFGLLLYVLAQATQSESEKARQDEAAEVKKLIEATGVSNITELTDELSKLAPIKELKGISDFINKTGGVEKVKKTAEIIERGGGADNVVARLEKLRKLEEGTGKPPCLFNAVGDRKVPKPLATVIAGDTTISFNGTNPDFEDVLKLVGRSYESVRELPLSEFRKVFSPLLQKKPDCRYTLRFLEKTRLVDARDAARFTFYLNIGKP